MHSVVNVPNGYVVWLHSTTHTHTQANTLRKTPQTLTHTHTKLIALFCYTELQLPVLHAVQSIQPAVGNYGWNSNKSKTHTMSLIVSWLPRLIRTKRMWYWEWSEEASGKKVTLDVMLWIHIAHLFLGMSINIVSCSRTCKSITVVPCLRASNPKKLIVANSRHAAFGNTWRYEMRDEQTTNTIFGDCERVFVERPFE